MEFLLIFIIGLFIGSFLNVLVDRLPQEESIVKGRSHCEKCKKELAWYDMIPLFSFVFLGGKCRYCHVRLSPYYPIIELTTGLLFVVAIFFVLNNFQFFPLHQGFAGQAIFSFQFLVTPFYYLFIASSLIVVFFADIKYGIIPDKIILPAIIISFLYLMFNMKHLILPHLFCALVTALFFFFLSLIKIRGHQAMGIGDVKFAFLMGLILGFPSIIVGLYVAFLTGAIVGCILIIWKRKKMFGATIPFGPFLVLGTFSAIFWGEIILQSII